MNSFRLGKFILFSNKNEKKQSEREREKLSGKLPLNNFLIKKYKIRANEE